MRFRFLIVAFVFGASPLICAESTSSEAAEISAARRIITTEILPKVPGVSVAVAIEEKIVWSEAFGYADLERKTPATSTTRFRIGSVSKPLTSIGLAQLVEQGAIDLDLPIQTYLPDFPKKEGVITIRLLGGHLSGIRNYRGREGLSNLPFENLHSALKIFENDPLESEPGTHYNYSSYNWNVIGVAMEAASHQDFLDYMEQHVFKPLGMLHTGPDRKNADDPLRAQFYEIAPDGHFVVAPSVDVSNKWPSGGFLSTADDLAQAGAALLQPGFLKQSSLDVLFTSQKTTSGKLTHYGLGWTAGKSVIYHGGDAIGGTAALVLSPGHHLVVAIACNRDALEQIPGADHYMLRKASDHFSSPVLIKASEEVIKVFSTDYAN